MKQIASGLLVLGLLAVQIPQADAAACAAAGLSCRMRRGWRGAVVTHRPAAVVRPAVVGRHCYYRAGVRVCR